MSHARVVGMVALIASLPFWALNGASAKPVLVIKLAQATVVTGSDGAEHLGPVNGSMPIGPGVVIRYTITAQDVGTDPASKVALSGHVPQGTAYAPGSLRGPGGHAEFSLDGRAFSAHPMVVVKTPAGDVLKPADPALYVMVRWLKDGPLAAKTTSAFSYDVQVK